jgi:hypothetical protein
MCHGSRQLFDGHSGAQWSAVRKDTAREYLCGKQCRSSVYICDGGLVRIPLDRPFVQNSIYRVMLWDAAVYVYSFSSSYYYLYSYYYLLQLSFHSVAVVLTLVIYKKKDT